MNRLTSSLTAVAIVAGTTLLAQEAGVVVFKSSVEQVAVAAQVRDAKGKLVKDLKSSDFELYDDGQKRPLSNVWSEPSPASVAILMDASGSMSTKMARARETATALVAGLKPGTDEIALYSFDTALQEGAGPVLAHIKIAAGTLEDLPRPAVTPVQVLDRLMAHIGTRFAGPSS